MCLLCNVNSLCILLHWCQKNVSWLICFRPLRLRNNYYEPLTQQISPTTEVWQLLRKISCLSHWRDDPCVTPFFMAVNDICYPFLLIGFYSWRSKQSMHLKDMRSWYSESNEAEVSFDPINWYAFCFILHFNWLERPKPDTRTEFGPLWRWLWKIIICTMGASMHAINPL